MVGGGAAPDGLVEFGASVAGGHGYGPAPCLSQGVEYFVDEAGYVPAGGFWRGVVDGVALGGG